MDPEYQDTKITPVQRFQKWFKWFETIMSFVIALVLAGILLVIIIRLVTFSYDLIFSKVLNPESITTENFTNIYGKIINMLITLEFLNSIIRGIKGRTLEGPVKDVMLITALALGRKLILMEYPGADWKSVIAMSVALVALGIFYYLINHQKRNINHAGTEENLASGLRINRK